MYFLPKTESEYKQTSPLSGCLLPQASLGETPRERWTSAQAPDNFKLTEIRLESFVHTFTWNLHSSYPSLGYAGRELMLLPTLNSCKQGSCTASGFIQPPRLGEGNLCFKQGLEIMPRYHKELILFS